MDMNTYRDINGNLRDVTTGEVLGVAGASVTAVKPNRATTIEVGDFVRVTAWRVFGQVVDVKLSTFRGDADDVLLQAWPETAPRLYRLRNGEFTFED